MRRARKIKATGRISGTLRRRLARQVRAVHLGWGPGCWAREPWEVRDARRLVEAGLCAAAISKAGMIGRREFALGVNREALKKRYWTLMPGGKR